VQFITHGHFPICHPYKPGLQNGKISFAEKEFPHAPATRSLVAFGQCHSWARDWLKAEPIYVFVIDEQLADAEKSIEGECFISVS